MKLRDNLYVVLPHFSRPQVLVRSDGDRWSLPRFSMSKEFLSFVDCISQSLHSKSGVKATVLHCLYFELSGEENLHAIYLMENHSPNWSPSDDDHWVGRKDLEKIDIVPPLHRKILLDWLEKAESRVPSLPLLPWMKAGWFKEAATWVEAQLLRSGYSTIDHIEQLGSSHLSSLLRIHTRDGIFYFKALPSYFHYEPSITNVLAELYPSNFPEIISVSVDSHFLLMKDACGIPLCDSTNIAHWEQVLREYSNIQIDFAERSDSLLALGCPDYRLIKLAEHVEPCLSYTSPTKGNNGFSLPHEVLRRTAEQLRRVCLKLEDYGIPPTLEHGDFHANNILIREKGPVYLDWTASSLSHPFFSLPIILGYIKHRLPDLHSEMTYLRDVYLEPWTKFNSMAHLVEAFELAEKLITVKSALAIYHLVMNQGAQTVEVKAALPSMLEKLAKRMHDLFY